MRKIIFVSLICLISTVSWFNSAQGETLPESIKEMVLKDIGFYEPVEISLLNNISTWDDNSWVQSFFVPNGYIKKWVVEDAHMVETMGGGYPASAKYGYGHTEKLQPYLRIEKSWPSDWLKITIAKRVLKSIDYTNRWKLNGLDTWSFTFTYFLESILPELPRLGPLKGKGTAQLNPATGGWKIVTFWDAGSDYGSSLGDSGGDSYDKWLKNQPTITLFDISGKWKGEYSFGKETRVEVELEIQQDNEIRKMISGKITEVKHDWEGYSSRKTEVSSYAGTIQGEISGLNIRLTIQYSGGGVVNFVGYLNANATKIYGNFLQKIGYHNVPCTMEKEGVSSKKSPQLPAQAPIITETPEKITIDSLIKKNISYNESKVQETLKRISTALENYARDYLGIFPANLSDLVQAQPPYLDRDYVAQSPIEGYIYSYSRLAPSDYSCSAVPVKVGSTGTMGNRSFHITTGGIMESVDSYSDIIHKNLEKELASKEKQPPYFVVIKGKQYKVSGDIFTGKKEGWFFKDEKGAVIRDLALAKKIAQTAWVYENIVRPSGPPRSQQVSAILNTYKALRRYEVAQDILARASVQILAATISGGTTLTYTVPAGLTWRVVRDQFVNLKGLLSLTGRQGIEEALSKYQQMESLMAKLKPNYIDEAAATEIKRLYDSAYVLDLPYRALLASLMPKKSRELVDKALKDIGDELVRTLPLSDPAISDAVLTNRELFDLQGKMDDALNTNPALKEYYEKLNLAKRLTEANEQVIAAWAEQAVGYKE